MKKIQLLRAITDAKTLSGIIFDLFKDMKTPEEIESLLNEDVQEDQIAGLKSIANSGYPLKL